MGRSLAACHATAPPQGTAHAVPPVIFACLPDYVSPEVSFQEGRVQIAHGKIPPAPNTALTVRLLSIHHFQTRLADI